MEDFKSEEELASFIVVKTKAAEEDENSTSLGA